MVSIKALFLEVVILLKSAFEGAALYYSTSHCSSEVLDFLQQFCRIFGKELCFRPHNACDRNLWFQMGRRPLDALLAREPASGHRFPA